MSELIAFLEARLAEDEKAARSAAGLCGCHPPAPSWHYGDEETEGRIVVVGDPHPHPQHPLPRPALNRRWHRTHRDLFAAEHITRWDPERVLKEVEAKRCIIARYEAAMNRPRLHQSARNRDLGHVSGAAQKVMLGLVLHDLAAVYDWHEDYRKEWNV